METPEDRYKKLLQKREEIMARTTPEERKAQMETFIQVLRDWGKQFKKRRGD